jgi:hypothetical protein
MGSWHIHLTWASTALGSMMEPDIDFINHATPDHAVGRVKARCPGWDSTMFQLLWSSSPPLFLMVTSGICPAQPEGWHVFNELQREDSS